MAQPFGIPLFFQAARRNVGLYRVRDDLFANGHDRILNLVGFHQFGALVIDNFALVVRDVVVLEQVFTNVEVMRFDLALRALDLA